MTTTKLSLNRTFILAIKSIWLVCMVCFAGQLAAQQMDRDTKNYLEYANKPYYFGITLGYNASNYSINRSSRLSVSDSILSITSPEGGGFNLGIIGNLKMGQYFDLRLMPTLSFADRKLVYETVTGRNVSKKIESVFVEIPFQVRYKSALYKDFRLFVLGGVKYTFDLASNSRTRQAPQLVKVAPSDFQVETGFGVQIFFPYFIFSPEIKFSHGINNALMFDKNLIYSNTMDQVFNRGITISFHFEG